QRGQTRPLARPQPVINGVVMQVSVPAAEASGIALGEHANDFIEFFAGQVVIWINLSRQVEQFVFGPFFAGDRGYYLLRENIQRCLGNDKLVEFGWREGVYQCGAFYEFVAARRKQSALRKAADRMARPADALKQSGY